MGSTVVQFREEYYEYRVDKDPEKRPITIGMLDAAWEADKVSTYLLEMAEATELNLFDIAKLLGMCQDDAFIVWEEDLDADCPADWLHRFQSCINDVVGGDNVQFTMDIWDP